MCKLKIQGNRLTVFLAYDRIAGKDNLEMGKGWITNENGEGQNKTCAQLPVARHTFTTLSAADIGVTNFIKK